MLFLALVFGFWLHARTPPAFLWRHATRAKGKAQTETQTKTELKLSPKLRWTERGELLELLEEKFAASKSSPL